MTLKRWLTFIALFLPLLVHGQSGKEITPQEVEVVLGIDKIVRLDFAPDSKVQIGNSALLDFQLIPQKREITFKGKKTGKTSVTIRNSVGDIKASYLVSITASDQSRKVQELKEFLGDIEGIEIGIKGKTVFVGGKIVVPSDIGIVRVVLDKYSDVMNLVELSPQTQSLIARKMQDEIQKNNLKQVTVRVINGTFWLEGIVGSNGEKARAQKIAVAYLPDTILNLARRTESVSFAEKDIIQNFIQVNAKSQPEQPKKQVKVTAQFVELTKDYNKVFGFSWTPTMAGNGGQIQIGKTSSGGVSTDGQGTLAATISNLFPKLSSAKNAGYARIIQSGVVLVEDGSKGTITKNSKKPFTVGNGEFAQPGEAQSGFTIDVEVKALPKEMVRMGIGVNVSSTIGTPPETLTNAITTKIVVKSKDSAVLGGIATNRTSTDYDKNPPFGGEQFEGTLPLFSFLRSKQHVSQKSQFAIFITPEIITSASEGTDEIKRKFRKRRR
jgi:pilus assembly protein CpaC